MIFIPTAKGLVYNMDSFRAKRMLRIYALSACTHKHIFAYIHLADTPQLGNMQYFRVWLLCNCYQFVIKRLLKVPQPRINTGFLRYSNLFPLDRSGRLWRQIVAHPVHARHLVCDPVCDVLQQGKRHVFYCGCHGVLRIHGADDHRPLKGTLAFLDAH